MMISLLSIRFLRGAVLAFWLAPAAALAVGPATQPSAMPHEEIPVINQELEQAIEKDGFAGSFLSSRFAKKQRDLDEASKYIEETLSHDPKNEGFLRDAVKVATLRGDIKAAMGYAHRLPEKAKAEPLIASLLGIESLDNNDKKTAVTYLEAVKARGLFAMIQPLLIEWLQLEGKNNPITMDEMIEKAGFFEPFIDYQLALMNDVNGHKDDALRFYKLAVESEELSPYRVVQALINFYARQARWDDVAKLIATYKAQNPDAALVPQTPSPTQPVATALVGNTREGMAEVFFTTASLLYSDQPALEVFWYLRLALYLRPDFPPAQFMLASLYEQIGANKRAISTYDSISHDNSFHQRAQIRKALNLEVTGEMEAALKLLDKVADAEPDNITALSTKGDMLRAAKKFDKAAAAYTKAIMRIGDVTSKDWGIFYARGICYEQSDAWDLAEADFKKALELSPDQPDVLNYLGYSWLMMNRNLAQAREMLRVAVEARPEDAHIIDSAGWAYYLTGDYARAVEYLEEAVNLAPLDMAMIDHLGDAYWRQGRAVEAQYQWQRVLQYAEKESELRAAAEKKLREGLDPFLPQQTKR